MKTTETKKKRSWDKPVVLDEQAGMEVTSYASAIFGAAQRSSTTTTAG